MPAPEPFFAIPPTGAPSRRRVLLLTHCFPPDARAGSVRWGRMSVHAAERGWGMDVVTIPPEDSRRIVGHLDESRLAGLPPDLRVFPAHDPVELPDERVLRGAIRTFSALRRAVRRSTARGAAGAAAPSVAVLPGGALPPLPDGGAATGMKGALLGVLAWQQLRAELTWVRRARAVGEEVADASQSSVVISSGPPHFVHAAASAVAQRQRIPHVMDLRDPWTLNEMAGPLARKRYRVLAERTERHVVEQAAVIACNTEPAAAAMRARYPAAADRVITVMNGSDDESPPPVPRDPRFLIAYAGAVYAGRSPSELFSAVARVVRELGLTPERFGLELMGFFDPDAAAVERLAGAAGLDGFIRLHPTKPRDECARFLASAAMLVSLPQVADMAVPSKVFEYASFDAWLLALATPHSATGMTLAGSAADVVDPRDIDGIAAAIRRRYEEWAAGVRPVAVGADGRFSRRTQATRLFDAIDAALDAAQRPRALATADVAAGAPA
ncbi:MAG TPA: hypothetical protein VEZ47_02875 [Gemmatirosa sp.]|nr:hypothetical protein [Gemmatirosa sp.]